MSRRIHANYREGQRYRRAQFRLNGLCPTCGGERDQAPHLTCVACCAASAESRRAHGHYVAPARQETSALAIGTVHPRWPVPLPGVIALSMVWGLRRRVAA